MAGGFLLAPTIASTLSSMASLEKGGFHQTPLKLVIFEKFDRSKKEMRSDRQK